MGNSTSKQATETRIFTPQTPVGISNNLVDQLESTVETDYTRSQYTEKYLQEETSKRLSELTAKTNDLFEKTLKDSLLTDDDSSNNEKSSLNSKNLNQKIDDLSKALMNQKSKIMQLNEDVLEKKKAIVECLIKNKERPLNCWDEVKSFEKTVKELK